MMQLGSHLYLRYAVVLLTSRLTPIFAVVQRSVNFQGHIFYSSLVFPALRCPNPASIRQQSNSIWLLGIFRSIENKKTDLARLFAFVSCEQVVENIGATANHINSVVFLTPHFELSCMWALGVSPFLFIILFPYLVHLVKKLQSPKDGRSSETWLQSALLISKKVTLFPEQSQWLYDPEGCLSLPAELWVWTLGKSTVIHGV